MDESINDRLSPSASTFRHTVPGSVSGSHRIPSFSRRDLSFGMKAQHSIFNLDIAEQGYDRIYDNIPAHTRLPGLFSHFAPSFFSSFGKNAICSAPRAASARVFTKRPNKKGEISAFLRRVSLRGTPGAPEKASRLGWLGTIYLFNSFFSSNSITPSAGLWSIAPTMRCGR